MNCPECAADLGGPSPTVKCQGCGRVFATRQVVVKSTRRRKVAGVQRHRITIHPAGGGDALDLEGPIEFQPETGSTWVFFYREGRPTAATIIRPGGEDASPPSPKGSFSLAPAASTDPALPTPGRPFLGAILWAIFLFAFWTLFFAIDYLS